MATREMALAAYRHLLRSTRYAFEGDAHRFVAARSAARQGFEANRSLSGAAVTDSIQHAEGVAKILRENLVQGQATDEEGTKYKLRIHKHTERGDNESIKGAQAPSEPVAPTLAGTSRPFRI